MDDRETHRDMHLPPELYLLMLRGELDPELLVQLVHQHLLERRPGERQHWGEPAGPAPGTGSGTGSGAGAEGGAGAPPYRPSPPLPATDDLPADDDDLSLAHLDDEAALLSRLRAASRRARQDVRQLLALPPERRLARIEGAVSRFRSRATATLLLDAARRAADRDPAEAGSLASLVPAVLHRISPPPDGEPWAVELEVLAAAHRAAATRAAGDPVTAAHQLSALRRSLPTPSPLSPAAEAELRRLESGSGGAGGRDGH